MKLHDLALRLLREFPDSGMDANLREQLSRCEVGEIEADDDGFFAEILPGPGVRPSISEMTVQSFVAVIMNTEEIGDAFLHIKQGLIWQLEVNLYMRSNWALLEGAALQR